MGLGTPSQITSTVNNFEVSILPRHFFNAAIWQGVPKKSTKFSSLNASITLLIFPPILLLWIYFEVRMPSRLSLGEKSLWQTLEGEVEQTPKIFIFEVSFSVTNAFHNRRKCAA